jgi:hypothetical protein
MTIANHSDVRATSRSWKRLAAISAVGMGAWRFWSTFARLIRHFAQDRGWQFWVMVAAIAASGFLYPIPFLLLAVLVRSAQTGQSSIHVGRGDWMIAVPHDTGVLVVLVAGILAILMHYAVARLVQQRTLAWQQSVLWHLLERLPECVRWDRPINLNVPLHPGRVANRLLMAARAGFLIGRLLDVGLRDAAVLIVALATLIWLDVAAVFVLIFISLLFLPVYGLALSDLVRGQLRNAAQVARANQTVQGWLRSEFVTGDHHRIDRQRITPALSAALSPAISQGLPQIAGLSMINAVAGIHLFSAFFAVFLADGGTLAALPESKLLFFLVLLVLLRAMQGLISLVSRLSRGYEGLTLLRDLLFAVNRPIAVNAVAQPEFDLTFDGGHSQILRPGDTVLFLAPQLTFAYQLLPLLEVIKPCFDWRNTHCRYVPLLNAEDLLRLSGGLVGQTAVEKTAVEKMVAEKIGQRGTPPGSAILRLPLMQEHGAGGDAPLVALTAASWRVLHKNKPVIAYLKARVTVIVIGPEQGPVLHKICADSGFPTIVSDGTTVIGVGAFAPMVAHYKASTAKSPATAEEADEIDEAG